MICSADIAGKTADIRTGPDYLRTLPDRISRSTREEAVAGRCRAMGVPGSNPWHFPFWRMLMPIFNEDGAICSECSSMVDVRGGSDWNNESNLCDQCKAERYDELITDVVNYLKTQKRVMETARGSRQLLDLDKKVRAWTVPIRQVSEEKK